MSRSFVAFVALSVALALPAVAGGATPAPANDQRAGAQLVRVGGTVHGTVTGSTIEPNEPGVSCSGIQGSVWYRLTSPPDGSVVVTLHANGDLDASVDVLQQVRSRFNDLGCDPTDDSGDAATAFRASSGGRFLIRVGQRYGSAGGTFTLTLKKGPPPARPPGKVVPRKGAHGTLDRVLHVDAAWSMRMRGGHSYRFNLVHGRFCLPLQLYAPPIDDFDLATPVKTLSCGGYGVYTPSPGSGGRYVFRVLADRGYRTNEGYTLFAGRVKRDDIAPGIFIRNYANRRGTVNGGGLDDVDVYRFDVVHRSHNDLELNGPGALDLELKNDRGANLACACDRASYEHIHLQLKPGRYYVAVRSRDLNKTSYRLTRQSRTITHAHVRIHGRPGAKVRSHTRIPITLKVWPKARGAGILWIEHLDPFEGWLPVRRYHVRVRRGLARVNWRPPSVGRWRMRLDFNGSRLFAPNASDYVYVLVADPLRQ